MIDYDQYQKGLVRISIIAQEKLGGVDKDLLQAKLDKETDKNAEQTAQKQKAKEKFQKKDTKSKEELEKLKAQFQED